MSQHKASPSQNSGKASEKRAWSEPVSPDPVSTNVNGEALRSLPSVEQTRQALEIQLREQHIEPLPPAALVNAARASIERARAAILAGNSAPTQADILAAAVMLVRESTHSHLRPVINAAGAILNTNLGRAPLSQRAIQRISEIASGYSNLEFDLEAGERGSRQSHTRNLLRALAGTEDALVVNNNAAATLLVLATLAAGREVIVSRGELVEIGGGFRVPDILAQSGARLVEVGTTNRVRVADYANAITPDTALVLSVHPSNFRIIGFTQSPTLVELATLAHERNLPLIRDLGSGAVFDTNRWGLAHESSIQDCVRAGIDVICFSGDKLLGGPQAGIIVGKRSLLERIERHPLMRAMRCDKLTLAALEATLQSYQDGSAETELPVWRAITTPLDETRARASRWVQALGEEGISAEVISGETTIGGGSLPGETLPTALCAIPARSASIEVDATRLARFLRNGSPSVVARVVRDQVIFDPRTVAPEQDDALVAAIVRAMYATTNDDSMASQAKVSR
jgi:L-seryl-tRNA(Ser) seleniumtransferase